MRGLCAVAYEEMVACPEITYSKTAEDARFITVIAVDDGLGGGVPKVSYDESSGTMEIVTNEGVHTLEIEFSEDENLSLPSQIALTVDSRLEEKSFIESVRDRVQSLF